MPDNLVSDTVKAGKEIYYDIKGHDPEKKKNTEYSASGSIGFSNTLSSISGESKEALLERCFTELAELAKRKLNTPNLAYRKDKHRFIESGSGVQVECNATVL